MKAFFKWIKSNPRTLAAVGSILAAITTAVLQFVGTLNLGEMWGSILSGGLGLLGTIFAGWAGFESNTTAEATSAARKELKDAAKEEANLNKLASEQLRIEKEAAAKAAKEAEEARLAQIKSALQAEAEKKTE